MARDHSHVNRTQCHFKTLNPKHSDILIRVSKCYAKKLMRENDAGFGDLLLLMLLLLQLHQKDQSQLHKLGLKFAAAATPPRDAALLAGFALLLPLA